ncbi:hypothetical protein LBUCD034_0110 [Lentilactobacillus buchneri subsp. silagei CD034]|uniref:Uncharacterized protein n=1 Tax=Lentilactobacillus buchneri subsp. silagei CD034 TaxID=1071400 RepID=J9VXN7_LENBU|nr:hypothetical protein LBUCD034_0110 [Lentilactobacillus buchneri subsp. silagei CD034]
MAGRCEREDHPYVRGEYALLSPSSWLSSGSPLRTWGIQDLTRTMPTGLGITPTYVGNTWLGLFGLLVSWDHPYVRGEYAHYIDPVPGSIGSPLRTWGILRLATSPTRAPGITPTYVGNTQSIASGKFQP